MEHVTSKPVISEGSKAFSTWHSWLCSITVLCISAMGFAGNAPKCQIPLNGIWLAETCQLSLLTIPLTCDFWTAQDCQPFKTKVCQVRRFVTISCGGRILESFKSSQSRFRQYKKRKDDEDKKIFLACPHCACNLSLAIDKQTRHISWH